MINNIHYEKFLQLKASVKVSKAKEDMTKTRTNPILSLKKERFAT
jgi:hypothetical protein